MRNQVLTTTETNHKPSTMSDPKHSVKLSERPPIALRWRIGISLLLLIHITAIAIPPFSLQTSGPAGTSPVADFLMRTFRPYIDVAFLNHGYAFFAPNPGPSHLLRARITWEPPREPVEETFPDLQEQWPRLLYHRHFMLSEQLNAQFEPPELPQELQQDREILARWSMRRQLYELKRQAFINHLRAKHGTADVELTRVRHRMIDVFEVRDQQKSLDARDTFIDLRETGPPAFELPPAGPPPAGPPPAGPPEPLMLRGVQ